MSAALYRGFYVSHLLKALKRSILAFVGIAPTRSSIIGNIEGLDEIRVREWLNKVSALGGQAQ